MQNEKPSKKEEIPKGYTRVTEIFKPYSKLDLVDPEILAYKSKIGDLTHHYVEMYSLHLLITACNCNTFRLRFSGIASRVA